MPPTTRTPFNVMSRAGRLAVLAAAAAGVTTMGAEAADARPVCGDVDITCPSPTTTVTPPDSDSQQPPREKADRDTEAADPDPEEAPESPESDEADPEPEPRETPVRRNPVTDRDIPLPGGSTPSERRGAGESSTDDDSSGPSNEGSPNRRRTPDDGPSNPVSGQTDGGGTGASTPTRSLRVAERDAERSGGSDSQSETEPDPELQPNPDPDDPAGDLDELLLGPMQDEGSPPSDADGRTPSRTGGNGTGSPADDPAPVEDPAPVDNDTTSGDDTTSPVDDDTTSPGSDTTPGDADSRDRDGKATPPLRKTLREAERLAEQGNPWAQTYLAGLPDHLRNSDSDQDPPPEYGTTEAPPEDLEDLLTAPMELDGEDTGAPAPEGEQGGNSEPARLTPKQLQKQMRRNTAELEDEYGDSPWLDFYTQGLQPKKPVRPEPAPETLDYLSPEERDEAILHPWAAPMFSEGEREGARRRIERRDIDDQRKDVRGELREEVEQDALPALLVGPMQLDADDVDDPVLSDTLCLTGSVTGCKPGQALTRLELDLLRETGDLTRAEDPDPTRRDSGWFKQREREHREAAERELAELQPDAESEYPEAPDWSWGGFMDKGLEHGKGLAVSSLKRSPAGLLVDPLGFMEENAKLAKGAGEGVVGIWDSGVMLWQLSPRGCAIDPDACAERQAEVAEIAEYAKADPEGFSKTLALAVINSEDLESGEYSEWAGNFAPDVLLAALTAGSGTAANGGLRSLRGLKALDDLPAPARTRALLNALGPGAGNRLNLSPNALARLEKMLVDASSGSGRPRYLPTRTSGASSEIRTIDEFTRRRGVRSVHVIDEVNRRGQRRPDFVAETRGGLERVESTIVTTGRGSGYRRNGSTRTGPLTTQAVTGAIRRKVGGDVTQFNTPFDLPDGRAVPEGGTLSLHLRRPAPEGRRTRAEFDEVGRQTMQTAREGIDESAQMLLDAKVRTVEVNLGGQTVRYRIRSNGKVVQQRIRSRSR